MIEVRWAPIPDLPASFTKTRIERGGGEQGPYQRIAEIDSIQNGQTVTQFIDPTGSRSGFYIIRFYDPPANQETDFVLGFFPLTPREKRLIGYVTEWIPDVIKPDLSEETIHLAFRLSIKSFNVHPPETNFTIDSFPSNYEQYLIAGAQVNLAMLKYLKFGIRDFSYGDMGFSLNIDRGAKIAKAAEDIGRIYSETVAMAKWNFISQGVGLGSLPLPISVGASLNRGLLNVLDVMTQLSR
jgi:hypothetical protein